MFRANKTEYIMHMLELPSSYISLETFIKIKASNPLKPSL